MKVKKTYRMSEKALTIIQQVKEEKNIKTEQAAIEYILQEYIKKDSSAEIITKQVRAANKDLMQRVQILGENIETILDILNTMLYVSDPRDEGIEKCMTAEEMPHPFLTSAQEQMKVRIARRKMIKDNRMRKNKE